MLLVENWLVEDALAVEVELSYVLACRVCCPAASRLPPAVWRTALGLALLPDGCVLDSCGGRSIASQCQEVSSQLGPMAAICDMTAGKAQVVQGMRQLVAAGCASLLPTPPSSYTSPTQSEARLRVMASRAWLVACKHCPPGDCVICCRLLCLRGMRYADGDSAMVGMPLHCCHAQSSRPILLSKEGMRRSNGLRRERTEGCACCAVESLASRLTGHSVAVKLQPRRDRRDRRDTARQPPTHALPSSCTLLTLASVASVQMGFAKAVSPVPSPLRAPSHPPTPLPSHPPNLPPALCSERWRKGKARRQGRFRPSFSSLDTV